MEILYESIFSFMILNVERVVSILYTLDSAIYRPVRKKAINGFFREALEKEFMETLKNVFFSLLLLNLIIKVIPHFLNAKLVCFFLRALQRKVMKTFEANFSVLYIQI